MKIAVVDCYASNTMLVDALESAGHQTVHVTSTATPPPCFADAAFPRTTHGTVDVSADWDGAVRDLANLNVARVFAGSEAGVACTDRLAEALGLPGNAPETTAQRRNKAAMQHALNERGLRTVKTWTVRSGTDLVSVRDQLPSHVICKPQDSFGNDGVEPHRTDTDHGWDSLCRAVGQQLGRPTVLGQVRDVLLIQEHLVGREIVVNTVSSEGRHVVTDCWEYTKVDVHGIADRVSAAVSLCPSEVPEDLLKYAMQTLDSVGIEHGPAHAEFFLTDNGPVLMEVAARLSGADTATHARESMGNSQVDTIVTGLEADYDWAQQAQTLPRAHKHVAMYYLTSSATGRFVDFPKLPAVEKLTSYWKFMPRVMFGDQLTPTADEFAEPGMVSLSHHDRSILWRDLLTLHYLDGDGFYTTDRDAT